MAKKRRRNRKPKPKTQPKQEGKGLLLFGFYQDERGNVNYDLHPATTWSHLTMIKSLLNNTMEKTSVLGSLANNQQQPSPIEQAPPKKKQTTKKNDEDIDFDAVIDITESEEEE